MATVKKVFKYGTGHVIPDGAIYLSTQVETHVSKIKIGEKDTEPEREESKTANMFVWHYFLVEVDED